MVATGTKHRVCLFLVALLGMAPAVWAQGRIEGVVKEQETGAPLSGVNIRVMGTQRGAASDADGRFAIANLPAGTYTLEPLMIGFEGRRTPVEVVDDTVVSVEILLVETVTALREVVVTPGRFAVMQAQPVVTQTFSRDDIQALPQLGEDIYRAARRLPGLAGNDFSSQMHVRGGLHDEVLVELDGMELYEPFHLKDIGGGALSVLDAEAIGGIDMMTGAFPAEYGDRLSGVFSITSATPQPGRSRTSFGLSFMNARFLSEGRFADDRGEWLLLARRGYHDLVLKITGDDDDFSPNYYDAFGKVKYRLDDRHSLSLHLLYADDNLNFSETEDDYDFQFTSGYGNAYGWVTWDAVWSPALYARTLLSVGRVDAERDGMEVERDDGFNNFTLHDDRAFSFIGLTQDWTLDLADRHVLKGGFEVKRLSATYNYSNEIREDFDAEQPTYDTTLVAMKPDGTEVGVYLAHRVRLARPLTLEWGARYDHLSWTGDDLWSPRVNLAYALGARTTLRAGWGRFYQPDGIHQVPVQDGERRFQRAERAEHRMLGITHALTPTIHARVELYQKKLSDLHLRYVNLEDATTDFAPEVSDDRVRLHPIGGDARGVEFFLRKDQGRTFNWLVSYSYAVVEDHILDADGTRLDVPRRFDQRHTLYLDANYQPNPKWRFSVAWQYHTGWPYTDLIFRRVAGEDGVFHVEGRWGPYNGARFPAFHRLDLRVRRYFEFSRSRLSVFAEVSNVYDRSNVRNYEYNVSLQPNGALRVNRLADDWLPLLPSIGISWDLYR